MVDEFPVADSIGKKEHPFKKKHRHKGRSDITITECPMKKVLKKKC